MSNSDSKQAYLILAAIAVFDILAYFANNPYEVWTLTAAPLPALLAYYFLSQPIYIGFLALFTYSIFKQDESLSSAVRGFVAAVLAMIGLDIMGLPYAVMSITNIQGTLQLISNAGLTPFGDWIIIAYIAGPSGVITFLNDFFVHVILPMILLAVSFFVARPKMFVDIVERS